MIGWLVKKYLKKHLSIRLQHLPMSAVEISLLLDDDVISSTSTNKIAVVNK